MTCPTPGRAVQNRPAAPLLHRADLRLGLVLAVVGGQWMTLLHAAEGSHEDGEPSLLVHMLRDGLLAAPLILVAVTIALLSRPRWPLALQAALRAPSAAALAASLALAAGNPVHALLFAGHEHRELSLAAHLGRDAAVAFLLALPVAHLTALAFGHRRSARRRSVLRSRPVTALAALITFLAIASAGVAGGAATATASGDSPSCLSGGAPDKSYDVTSLDVDITLNKFGDHDPGGKMYALTSAIPAVRAQEKSRQVSTGLRDDPIQPLVVRANEGDCVEITYTNQASGGRFGMHIDGLVFDTRTSSGDDVGANASSSVAKGGTLTYRFFVPNDDRMEGAHYIHPGPGARPAVDHGLFGSLVVEPRGSTYWNASSTGVPLVSGWEAIIVPGDALLGCLPSTRSCAFREAVKLHHEVGNDNEVLRDKFGAAVPQQDTVTGGYRPGSFALNYRSEPFRNRLIAFPKEKSHSYSSYTFGDPATPMPRGYLGDPTKFRILHAGGEKFHVYHLHGGGDRWRMNPVADRTGNYAETGLNKYPGASASARLDSQSLGPGESFNLELEGGAGGVQQSVGDFLFHCHIAKHYVAGMWSVWRVYNTLQPDLVPLPDRGVPAAPVDSADLIGKTINRVDANGTARPITITADNIDAWVRGLLPAPGVKRGAQDAIVWDWMVSTSSRGPLYLGEPVDPTNFADSPREVAGQPNLLRIDAAFPIVENRPRILFDPATGRLAYPLLRPHIGTRPPFTGNGHTGTPYLGNTANAGSLTAPDPNAARSDGLCPSGAPLKTFNVVAVEKAFARTSKGVQDNEGKVFVLAGDKADVLAGRKPVQPLAVRLNQGDCAAVTLTNEMTDRNTFDQFSKTSMHIHHVQFDVQGSDGVSAGFAYEHSVRPYKVEDPTLTANAASGATTLSLSNVDKLVGKDASGRPIQPWIAVGQGTEGIEIVQVLAVDTARKQVTMTAPLARAHASAEYAGTEFIQYRWYPDVVLDNVFWHDHVDGIHGWGHGLVGQLIVEPAGSTYHDPTTGAEVRSGTIVDIHTSTPLAPGLVNGSYRELALWSIDDNDKDAYSTLNLRAEPYGDRSDPANRFSSYTYGDPNTPLPRLYPGDPLVIRTIAVSPTVDTLHVQGARFPVEFRYLDNGWPESTLRDTIHAGISERYTLILNADKPGLRMPAGDYLYSNGIGHRAAAGAWGIIRVLPGATSTLKPLPENAAPGTTWTAPARTGKAPPTDPSPGNPCPSGAPTRSFDVSAVTLPLGSTPVAAFVDTAQATAVSTGVTAPEPLVMHVVAGECVTVHFTNQRLDASSFSVSKLERDPRSSGVNVGYTPQQNTAPGGTRDYVYYVPNVQLGSGTIVDLAHERNAKDGLYGAVVVSPAATTAGERTTFTDPVTGASKSIGSQLVVNAPGTKNPIYRDSTLIFADDDPAISQDFMPYPDKVAGDKASVNYRHAALGDAFRDPGPTPVVTSYAGDPIVVHLIVAPSSEQMHSLTLGGPSFSDDPHLSKGNLVSTTGIGPWESTDAEIQGGAGGEGKQAGDYWYGDLRRPFAEAGMWGLQRVLTPGDPSCPVLPLGSSTC